jgi:hypothetical protein
MPDNKKIAFGIYLIFIILIILFPPIDWRGSATNIQFEGWYFITWLGGDSKINVVYFLGEIGIISLIYFFNFDKFLAVSKINLSAI